MVAVLETMSMLGVCFKTILEVVAEKQEMMDLSQWF